MTLDEWRLARNRARLRASRAGNDVDGERVLGEAYARTVVVNP
jgi:hypothetical protein